MTTAAITRRIFGIETEYGITSVKSSTRRLGPDEVSRQLFAPIVETYRSSNIYTDNGSRLYLDVGAHPEIATAECDSIHQLLAYDRAGDRQVQALAEGAQQVLDGKGVGGSIYLLKNNTDSLGNSYGCHENYLVSRNIPLKALGTQLLPFLVTRQLICGSGKLSIPRAGAPNEHFGSGYTMSQRADHVWEGVSSATTRSRPIINTRDEPHADSSKYRRLHVIVGDSNMSEVTCALKIASTQLVLELIENGAQLPDFELANEIRSIREVARDFSGCSEISLRNGSTATALEIQRCFHDAARTWLAQRPDVERGPEGWLGTPNEQLEPLVAVWGRVLDCFDTGDFAPVAKDIDWVIKKNLMDKMAERHNLEPLDPRLAHIDLTYHDINEERGLFHVLARRGQANRILSDEAISAAQTTAPATTRAAIRSQFLKAVRQHDASYTVDWTRVKINGEGGGEVALPDPFANHDDAVDALIETLRD